MENQAGLLNSIYKKADYWLVRGKVAEYRNLGAMLEEPRQQRIEVIRSSLQDRTKAYFERELKESNIKGYFEVMSQLAAITYDIVGKQLYKNNDSSQGLRDEVLKTALRVGLDFMVLKLVNDGCTSTKDAYEAWNQWDKIRSYQDIEEVQITSKLFDSTVIADTVYKLDEFPDLVELQKLDKNSLIITENLSNAKFWYWFSSSNWNKHRAAKNIGSWAGKLMHYDLTIEEPMPKNVESFLTLQGVTAKIHDDTKDFFKDRRENRGYSLGILPVLLFGDFAGYINTSVAAGFIGPKAFSKFQAFMALGLLFQAREFLGVKNRT